MMRPTTVLLCLLGVVAIAVACGEAVIIPGTGTGGVGGASATMVVTSTGGGAESGSGAASATSTGGGAPECEPVQFKSLLFACGDCKDNDGDGRVDMADEHCTGPADDHEDSFYQTFVNGCDLDCAFDYGSGTGNDDCHWSHHCDPLEVSGCSYDATHSPFTSDKTCAELAASQSPTCHQNCGPLVPNGCDCFGCCELPAESGNYVFLSSVSGDFSNQFCTLDHALDPQRCFPCTPVPGCLNPCESCELCLGKSTLPTGCGSVQQCPDDKPPCGLEGQGSCPSGHFCLTGCCTWVP